MRIIRGKYKGRHIPTPTGFKARPTTDFAKEGLFNILENVYVDFDEAPAALDLFAGTGSIGLELASRGCGKVVSVEKDCGGERFTDVTLTGFKTSSVLAPVTSFFLPGYATYQQGVHSTWVGRTLSCYLLGGISYLAFQQSKKNADIDPTDATNPLQNHIVTQVAAYGCLTIASTIYITDLVQSISYATRNISRSKQLRKDLRKQAINIQTQDIRLR